MTQTATEKQILDAIANAAEQVAKATDPNEAAKWQGIQNQQHVSLREVRAAKS